jgi:hypothetical protein
VPLLLLSTACRPCFPLYRRIMAFGFRLGAVVVVAALFVARGQPLTAVFILAAAALSFALLSSPSQPQDKNRPTGAHTASATLCVQTHKNERESGTALVCYHHISPFPLPFPFDESDSTGDELERAVRRVQAVVPNTSAAAARKALGISWRLVSLSLSLSLSPFAPFPAQSRACDETLCCP